ncbi:MAG: hypothetical protein E6Q56_08710 [Mycobacterium sp.]|nr:MAG: hypothetical protein E6Q56_08710 [Mycobacterium sp.]
MKSDVAQQHLLLKLAGMDAELVRLAHRITHLPEQQAYDSALAEHRAATDRVAVLAVALDDVEAEVSKLESEVDAVRRREDRDRALLDSGGVNPKQLAELQHELTTLERRQADLEDILLEVMERREEIAGNHAAQQAAAEALGRDADAARQARDEAVAGIEQARAEQDARRAELAAELDAELLALYDAQRSSGGIGAGLLQAGRCGACRIELDRGEIGRIAAAADDEVLRCPECRAILVRPIKSGAAQPNPHAGA